MAVDCWRVSLVGVLVPEAPWVWRLLPCPDPGLRQLMGVLVSARPRIRRGAAYRFSPAPLIVAILEGTVRWGIWI